MGDFDKKDTTSPAEAAAREKRKFLVLAVLGAALVALIGNQFMKGGPQTARAFGGSEHPDASKTTHSPVQALAELDPSRDPTAKLLLGTPDLPKDFLAVPRNPFKLSDDMRAQLVKPVEVKPQPIRTVQTPQVIVTEPKSPPPDIAGFKLQGIFRRGDKLFASVNGNIVTINSVIGKARVVDIRDDQVLFQHADFPGGPVSGLYLK